MAAQVLVQYPEMRILAGFWLLLLCLPPAQAATLERLSLEEMIQKSTAIVRGRVIGSYAEFRGPVIYTHLRLQVLERWKGAQQQTMEVLVPGGSARGVRQLFSGTPQLIPGKEYLLFLWTSRSGLTQIIGLTQGIFDLPKGSLGDGMAIRSATTETMLDPQTGQLVKDERLEIRLSDLSARIRVSLMKDATK